MSPEFKTNALEDNKEPTIDQTTLFKKDAEGNLLPIVSKDTVSPSWKELIDTTKEAGLEFLGDNTISIYVTGSVARGVPDEKNSDLDMFAIVHTAISREDENKLEEKIKSLSHADVSFHAIPITKLIGNSTKPRMQFIIKLLSTPVYGEDLSSLLPDWKADINTARALTENIEQYIEKVKTALKQTHDNEKTAYYCRKAAKKFIRQAFYGAMIKLGVYTSSFETAYALSLKVYPEKKDLLKQVFDMYVHPTSDKEKILALVNAISPWIIDETNKLHEN